MLGMLGTSFTTHSVVLVEDVPLADEAFHPDTNSQRINDLYNKVGYKCFIAAGLYMMFGAFSCCQMMLNKQRDNLGQ